MEAKRSSEKSLSKKRVRLVLVDDHPIMRTGLSQLLTQDPNLHVCGEFEDAEPALDGICELKPDLVILDISLKKSNGIELMKVLKERLPELKVLVLSMHDESLYAERVLRAGGSGYIMKQEAPERVLTAIQRICNGEIYLSDRMSSKIMHQLIGGKAITSHSPMERLSDRELEIFGLIGQGHGTRQIAEQLQLSIKTVESHRAHIKEKLHLRNANELVHRAIQFRSE